MRIMHVNLFDIEGGAARVAWTLMDSMTVRGHDSRIFAHRGSTSDSRVIPIPFPQTGWQQALLRRQSQQGLFDLYSAALLKVLEHPFFEQADILHLHCINGGYFSFLLLPFLTVKPTVWTLHDPLAFTAGCLNTDCCEEWRHNWCAECPQDAVDKSKSMQRELVQLIKTSIYKIAKFIVVCPSAWLENQVRDSILQGHDIRLIHNGIDIQTFCPGDRAKLRAELGLPLTKKIIMFAAHGGFNSSLKGGRFLYEALTKLYHRYPELLLLNIGTVDNSVIAGLPTERMDIPFIADPAVLAQYYGAADLFVSPSPLENCSLAVCEAMACGTPVVAFSVGGTPELVLHKETGYLAKRGDSDDFAEGIAYFLDHVDSSARVGLAARQRAVENFSDGTMVDRYCELYEDMLKQAGGLHLMSLGNDFFQRLTAKSQNDGWESVWREFGGLHRTFERKNTQQQAVFTDRFFSFCLQSVKPTVQSSLFWDIVQQWWHYRRMPLRCGNMAAAEYTELLIFCRVLREKTHELLAYCSLEEFSRLSTQRQQLLITVWRQVFLNSFSPLHLEEDCTAKSECGFFASSSDIRTGYLQLMVASMYHPFTADDFIDIDAELWNLSIPLCAKALLAFWLMNTPYFNVAERHRKKLLTYAPKLFQTSMPPDFFSQFLYSSLDAFWRVSYTGGNNVEALAAFGDFISAHVARLYPQFHAPLLDVRTHRGEKLRIGYISRMFYRQAVSYYMVNRIIHCDKNKFEVYVFALGDYHDDMSELFVKYSDHFYRFANLENVDLACIAQRIIDSRLDILIYTDIGMDPVTYMLASMQLAPIQCALVGHGTTSGIPAIQYYLSGDFETDDAETHYRETLIRLPCLGAAQYPPAFTQESLPARKDWKIPEDVVVFVSCANGIKHIPARDDVLIEILKQAPNACIVLKPYYSDQESSLFKKRIMAKARAAGVEQRLFVIPPLAHVEALLAIADVQLDTYPYGGWTTNMEALYMGLPIVTQEGEVARSRWGAHMLRSLGIEEGIAANEREYVVWAVRFTRDEALRRQVRNKIKATAREVLFNGKAAQSAYEETLLQIAGLQSEK